MKKYFKFKFNLIVIKESVTESEKLDLLSLYLKLKGLENDVTDILLKNEKPNVIKFDKSILNVKHKTDGFFRHISNDMKGCNSVIYPFLNKIYFLSVEDIKRLGYYCFSNITYVVVGSKGISLKDKKTLTYLKNRLLKFNALLGLFNFYFIPSAILRSKDEFKEMTYSKYEDTQYVMNNRLEIVKYYNTILKRKPSSIILMNRMQILDFIPIKDKIIQLLQFYEKFVKLHKEERKILREKDYIVNLNLLTSLILDDFYVDLGEKDFKLCKRFNYTKATTIVFMNNYNIFIMLSSIRDKYNPIKHLWKVVYKIKNNTNYKEFLKLVSGTTKYSRKFILNNYKPNMNINLWNDLRKISLEYKDVITPFGIDSIITDKISKDRHLEFYKKYYEILSKHGLYPNIKEMSYGLLDEFGEGFSDKRKYIPTKISYNYDDGFSEFFVFKPSGYYSGLLVTNVKYFV
jgi:hypothetical protein